MLRVGIVGCGKIADSHVDQVRATGLAEVVAVCDAEPLMARQLAFRYSIPATYGKYQEMLSKESLDVVHIATPPDSHLSLACEAATAGCHVFVEKPFAMNADQARRMTDEVSRLGRKLAVNYLYNFEAPTLKLLQYFRSGRMGEIVHIDANYGYDLAGSYGLAVLSDSSHWVHRLPGKLFHNVIDHVICKIIPLLGPAEIHIQCDAFRRRPPTGQTAIDCMPDELRVLLRCGETTANIVISAHARPVCHTMHVRGSSDSMELDFVARTAVPVARQRHAGSIGRALISRTHAQQFRRAWQGNLRDFLNYDFHFFQGMRVLLRRFYASIERGEESPTSTQEILRGCELIDQIVAAVDASVRRTGAATP